MSRFTFEQQGALLIAIGEQMLENNLCFGAVFDGNSKEALLLSLAVDHPDTDITNEQRDKEIQKLLAMSPEEVLAELETYE